MFSGGEKNFILNSVIGSSSNTTLPKNRNFACFYGALRYRYIKVLCFLRGL
jgi:hypothetical protein